MLKAAEGDALPSIDVDEGKWRAWPMGGIEPRHEWVRQIQITIPGRCQYKVW